MRNILLWGNLMFQERKADVRSGLVKSRKRVNTRKT